MRKWAARVVLVLLALAVLACLPATLLFSLLRNWLADRPFAFWYEVTVGDLAEMAGFFRAQWRDTDNGDESGV